MNDSNSSFKKISSGLFWTFGERITAQLVSTIVSIVLARILTPEHYGIISIIMVFITFCNVFVSSGFNSAIIQKKDVDENDYNTGLVLGLSIGISLYVILFILSPLIADFYNMDELKWVLRVMAIRLPLASVNSMQQAHIQRKMEFKKFFISTSLGTIISGVVGIVLAIYGFGVWALVAQYLTNTLVDTIVLFFVDDWRPRFVFISSKCKAIFSFGWKVLLSTLVYTIEEDIKSLIVGKVFGPSDLAYYDQGKKYPAVLVNNINAAINKVMLPTYSRQQSIKDLKRILRKSIQVGIFTMAPLMIGFAVVAEDFVYVVLTEKWAVAIPYIQVFCLCYLTRPLETSCQQAILALGRSDLTLKIMIAVNITSLTTLLIAVFAFHSIFLIAVGSVCYTLVSLFLHMYFSQKLIGYNTKEQLQDILPSITCSIIMGFFVVVIRMMINCHSVLGLIFQIVIGGAIYIALSIATKNSALLFVMDKIRGKKTI